MTIRYITKEVKDQFVRFMMRDGWSYADATKEIQYMMGIDDALIGQEFYVYYVRRIGATRTLTRVGRRGVYQTMENAFNHVTFMEAA